MNNIIKNEMPLLEYTSALFKDNSRYVIVACQHFLESNAEMLLKLVDKGFDPKKMYIISKAYSHNVEVARILKNSGMKTIRPLYYPNSPFDEAHRQNITMTMNIVERNHPTKDWLLIDDGGALIDYVNHFSIEHNIWKRHYPKSVCGVEQTSSGYNLLNAKELQMPIINIARSNTKLNLESPHIADLVVSRLENYLQNNHRTGEHNTLILGAGPIGLSIRDKLKDKYNVTLYDTSTNNYTVLEKLLENKDIIIGCTGKTSIPAEYHKYLKNAILVNAASSDREFDAHHLRQDYIKYSKGDRIWTPHKNYDLSKIGLEGCVLLNSGFPITFQGNRNEGDPKIMQLTHSLMYAGVMSLTQNQYENGLHQLDTKIEQSIRKKYENMMKK